ncbi:alpha/beta fold hydrolase [Deinococcus deserti]|uniref:Putative alpha/beta hydrolase fold protein n=1 Tax=Deinococcus deserti (strain DSM 17065 / CIP 109153 / LMG 22923 / VCD115) TaxID=546414 RepID=C1CWY9_DEIDV|nr:alpha/beta hydrolase [Deinococcus deserti]ACO46706.1 putative alpha/beta hydrolase fold protein [Deinococcus deserti VCD115]
MTRLPTVVMLHAYPLSAAMWDKQARALEDAGMRVLKPDLPGFGGQDGHMTSLQDTAQALLETFPEEPLALVGLSMGGYLALELLAQAPGRFDRVVLADTTLRADSPEKQADRLAQAERVLREGSGFLVEAARDEHAPATFEQVKPMIELASRSGIAGALRAMAERQDQRHTLEALKVPLLVVVGANDQLTPVDRAQEIAAAGRGQLMVLPEAAHLSNMDQPEAFNTALLEFLKS